MKKQIKILISFIFSILLLTLFTLIFIDEMSSQSANSRFTKYIPMIESFNAITDVTKEIDKNYILVDDSSKMEFIDIIKLKEMLSKDSPKNTLIHIWSTIYDESSTEISKINKNKSLLNYNLILICADVSTKAQINLARRYLNKIGFLEESYILYQNYNSINDVIVNIKKRTEINQFIKNLDSEYNDKLPYTMIVNRQNKIIYRKEGSISFDKHYLMNDSLSQITNINGKTLKSIFSNYQEKITENDSLEKNTVADLSFKSQLTKDIDGDYKIDDSLCKIIPINKNEFVSLLNVTPRKKSIIHFWASWCSGQSKGIEGIINLIPKDNSYRLFLISTDIYTNQQMKLIRAFLYENNIFTDSYILVNKIGKYETIDEFGTEKVSQVIDFIKSFDSSYNQASMPYTAVIDESGMLIYRRHPLLESELLYNKSIDSLNNTQRDELINAFNEIEVKKIKEITTVQLKNNL